MKHYLDIEEHKEIGKKLKDIEASLSSLLPMINKFPKSSKVAKNFYPLLTQNNQHLLELKSALENDLPFEDTVNYPDNQQLLRIYYGGKGNERL